MTSKQKNDKLIHVVYLLLCVSKNGKTSVYAGYTTDFPARFEKHQNGKGAKYTRAHRPVSGRVVARFSSKSEALKYELELKRLSSARKVAMLRGLSSERRPSSEKVISG